jgi:hypothetical protein
MLALSAVWYSIARRARYARLKSSAYRNSALIEMGVVPANIPPSDLDSLGRLCVRTYFCNTFFYYS